MKSNKNGCFSHSERSTFARVRKSMAALLMVGICAFHGSAWITPSRVAADETTTTATQEQQQVEGDKPGRKSKDSQGVGQQTIDLPSLDKVQCASYFCYDRTAKQVILSKNENKKIYPASMTKILTLSLAMEYLDPHEKITVSKSAMDATTPNSTMMGLVTGEEIEVNELYFGLMLPSGNDAANVLAEAIATRRAEVDPLPTSTPTPTPEGNTGKTEETTPGKISLIGQFARIANEKIAELGLTSSHFINPNGLQHDNHYTTAKELAMMFDYALTFEDFRTVIHTPTHVFKADNKHPFDGWKIVRNTNFLLQDPWLLGEDSHCVEIFGGKTGTTKAAGTGMTLLTINENGHEIITSVCGIPYDMSDHQSVYVASVVKAANIECWELDPVTRVKGNIMDYRSYNAPQGQEPTGDKQFIHIGGTPTPVPTPEETVPPTSDTTVTTSAPVQQEKDESFFGQHPVLVIVLIVLSVVAIVLVIFTVMSVTRAKRRRRRMGIRKIR